LAHMIRPASQQHIKAFKNPKGLNKRKGVVSRSTGSFDGFKKKPSGRWGWGSHSISKSPNSSMSRKSFEFSPDALPPLKKSGMRAVSAIESILIAL
jgi:hypothetical protein